ncbi:phosphatase PAP2 family protein [Sphingobacterium sp. HMA12]|uniref:phosphatase PAP2 family protein n=1 Tax=Sphingobacterium sp. HMA12 TaxID=2050894 RepID=UPI0013155D06|nr:phosphatase PAP2 family protein [Sphingobacterium sp. HMA12]
MIKVIQKQLKKIYNTNPTFFHIISIWFLLIAFLLLFVTKRESFQFVNSHHAFWADIFMTVNTFVGDGISIIALAAVCCFLKKWNFAKGIFGTYIFSGVVCCVLKSIFHAERPAAMFRGDPTLHVVSWLPVAYTNSFPSGHTTSAFAMAATIAIISKSKKMGLFCFILAALTGYSRIYLGQHFLEDVGFGSLLGVGTTCIYFIVMPMISRNKFLVFNYKFPQIKLMRAVLPVTVDRRRSKQDRTPQG